MRMRSIVIDLAVLPEAVVPTWRCTGVFSGDSSSYDVDCTTNLEVTSVECTLDGASYNCKPTSERIQSSGVLFHPPTVVVVTKHSASLYILASKFEFLVYVHVRTSYGFKTCSSKKMEFRQSQ